MKVKQGKKLYEGKAKILYETSDPDLVIQHFKDDATAFDALKKGTIKDKGIVNNRMSEILLKLLESKGIPTHFVERLNERDMLCRKVKIIPVEVVVRNIIAGSLSKRLGIEEGEVLKKTVVELYYKDDALHDPMINSYHIAALGLCTEAQLKYMEEYSLLANRILKGFFKKRSLDLVDFKLEFGIHKAKVLLADEISPDTCRFWDTKTREKLDKDRFRRDLGKIEEAYKEVLKRVESGSQNA